jgi:hypothetical protein
MTLVDLHRGLKWLYLSDGSKVLGIRGWDGVFYRATMDSETGDVFSSELEPGDVLRFCNSVYPPELGDEWDLVKK